MSCKLFNTIILAAGKSQRMFSSMSKMFHRIGGKYILQHVIDTAIEINSENIYVVYSDSYNKKFLIDTLDTKKSRSCMHWVLQSPSCGTGDAVKRVLPFLSDNLDVLILYGDVPLLSSHTLYKLFHVKPHGGISLLTAFLENPDGYGRIIRQDAGKVIDIIEDSDIYGEQKFINEVNTGIMIVTGRDLKRWVHCIRNVNNAREFRLTDIINIASSEGCIINTVLPNEDYEVNGVNNKLQLVKLERVYQRKQAEYLLASGVVVSDLNRFDLRGELYHGDEVYIDVNVIIEGKVFIGNRVNIGMGCVLKNSIIYDDVIIYPYSLVDGAKIHAHSVVGPFARLRSGTELGEKSFIGNFVEMKNTKLGKGSKISHISYMGDIDVGEMVNIGAGVIVCNYDGVEKHKTVIGDNVFIGSDSQLVAPITIGSGAKVGAGTTVTRDVLPNEMIISRVRQFPITCWKRSLKKKRES